LFYGDRNEIPSPTHRRTHILHRHLTTNTIQNGREREITGYRYPPPYIPSKSRKSNPHFTITNQSQISNHQSPGLSLGIGLSYLALKSDQESWLAPQEAVTAPQDNDKKATVSHGRPPAPLTPFPTPTKPNTSQKNPRPTILAGNWKCNPSTLTSAKQLISSLNQSCPATPSNVKVIIAFPSLFLSTALACMRDDFIVAAQDSGAVPSKGGAYTGEASPTQLVSLGVTHVVLGHSERREGFQASASANSEGESSGESSLFVASKVKLAVEAGMTVLLCVGEKKAERENGTTLDVVASQLAPVVAALEPADWANVIIAYEVSLAMNQLSSLQHQHQHPRLK